MEMSWKCFTKLSLKCNGSFMDVDGRYIEVSWTFMGVSWKFHEVFMKPSWKYNGSFMDVVGGSDMEVLCALLEGSRKCHKSVMELHGCHGRSWKFYRRCLGRFMKVS